MSEAKVSNQQLQAYRQDRLENVTYSWEWPKLDDAMHDLLDARARIAELEHPGRTQFCLGCEQHARKVAELEAALAQQKQMYEQEAKWRKAYQEAKGKMYEAGGEIGQFAIDNMPCNEGELDLWFRKIYVSREAYDSLKAELEAQLAEARRDGERWRWWMADYKRDIAGLFDGVAQGWTKTEWDEFVDGKIAAAAAEGEKK